MKKKSFIFYLDNYTESVKKLTYEQKGMLFDAIVFHGGGNATQPDLGLLSLAFDPIKATMDRDYDKWLKTCERNKNNGKKGGRPKEPTETQSNPLGFLETQKNPQKPDNDNDNDTDNDKYPTEISSLVTRFIDFISERYGKQAPSNPNHNQYCDTVEKLMRIDGFTLDEIRETINFAMADDFWKMQVLSLGVLRTKKDGLTKFQKIYNKMKEQSQGELQWKSM